MSRRHIPSPALVHSDSDSSDGEDHSHHSSRGDNPSKDKVSSGFSFKPNLTVMAVGGTVAILAAVMWAMYSSMKERINVMERQNESLARAVYMVLGTADQNLDAQLAGQPTSSPTQPPATAHQAPQPAPQATPLPPSTQPVPTPQTVNHSVDQLSAMPVQPTTSSVQDDPEQRPHATLIDLMRTAQARTSSPAAE